MLSHLISEIPVIPRASSDPVNQKWHAYVLYFVISCSFVV